MRILVAFMIKRTAVCLLLLIAGSAVLCAAQSRRVADLDPQLRDALVRDAGCDANRGAAPSAVDRVEMLQTRVNTQTFRGAGGRMTGIITTPTGGCQCVEGNCSIYVYVKSGQGLRLVLNERLATLRPMRVYKHGLPSLTGKFQVNASKAETTVFDWNGKEYQASLCATVTQTRNPRRPAIAKHECRKSGGEDQP